MRSIRAWLQLIWSAIVGGQVQAQQILISQGLLMASVADFKAAVLVKIEELKSASAAEHDQVLAAIDVLQAQVSDAVSDDDLADVTAAFDAAKSAIGGIYEPAAPSA